MIENTQSNLYEAIRGLNLPRPNPLPQGRGKEGIRVFSLMLSLLVALFTLTGCVEERIFSPQGFRLQEITLKSPQGEKIEVVVEVAETKEEKKIGLMGREELKDGHGMLFISETPYRQSFWMKNTLIPLDIIFFDGNGKVVSFETMMPCKADPCPFYNSKGAAMFALELPSGFVNEFGVDRGWVMLK